MNFSTGTEAAQALTVIVVQHLRDLIARELIAAAGPERFATLVRVATDETIWGLFVTGAITLTSIN